METNQKTQQQSGSHYQYLGYMKTLGHLALYTHYGTELPGLGVTIEYLTGETQPYGDTVEYELKMLRFFIDYQSDGTKSVRTETYTFWTLDPEFPYGDLFITFEVSRTSTS